MWKEFREFVSRGNVLDLAVAVVIGAAFTSIVTSLVQDIINPLIGLIGDRDFTQYYIVLSGAPADRTYAVAKTQASVLGYGAFLTAVINFLIIAAAIFLFVKAANTLQRKKKEEDEPKAPELSKDQQLLTEIRDILQGTPGSKAVAPPEGSTSGTNAPRA